MSMSWRDLLFLHFPTEPSSIQQRLPTGLTVDTYPDETGREMAWVGLVPFRMEGVRPKGLPRLRSCEDFPETNVRTYCHVGGKDPGVWFFSLDAANPFACLYARSRFHLNYLYAKMTVERRNDTLRYESRRCRAPNERNRVNACIGREIGAAEPGTLEFFLVERYLLYSLRGTRLFKGQVFHPPYQLRLVESFDCLSGLVEANGIPANPFSHAVFSEGLDVSASMVSAVEL